ncbi:ROK family protein [Streptomyces sp. 15-116A]|uniref:ROK family transcriptional regulator n=1 Tax=Streptomyces sp. 15-116A TaxID=2259035 RepID=UPI0037D99133
MGGVNRANGGGSVGAGRAAGAGVNLLALRSHNSALVLDLLRAAGAGGISRLEIAERTGLTPQAVSKITARLREDGLAAEAGRRASTGGKPRTVLRLVPEAGHAVGVHLDRDELRAVLVDLNGTVVAEQRAPLDLGAGAEAVLGRVARAVDAVRREERAVDAVRREDGAAAEVRSLLGVGVALPGPLDHRRGVLHRVTGFPEWDGFPLRDALAGRLGVAVVVDKDTNAAALGLAVKGAGSVGGAEGGGGAKGAGGVGSVEGGGGAKGAAGVEGVERPEGRGPGDGGTEGDERGSGLGLTETVQDAASAVGVRGRGGSFAYLHLGTGLGAGLVIDGGVHRGVRTGAGEFGHQVVQLDGPP